VATTYDTEYNFKITKSGESFAPSPFLNHDDSSSCGIKKTDILDNSVIKNVIPAFRAGLIHRKVEENKDGVLVENIYFKT
jgi:hypothetical protein